MAKNITIKPFNNFCKKVAKTDRLFLQDCEGNVYISEGHFVVKVSRSFYDACIKPDLIFDVPENSRVTIEKNKVGESNFNIKDCFDRRPENLIPTKYTSLILDKDMGEGRVRIFRSENGRFTPIDTKFIDILLYFGFAAAQVDAENPEKTPIFTDDFLVLPVNMDVKRILTEMIA